MLDQEYQIGKLFGQQSDDRPSRRDPARNLVRMGCEGARASVQPCGVGWTGCGPVRGSGPQCSTGTLRGGSGPTALAWPIVGRVPGAACASVLLQVWAASAPESAVAFEYSLYPMLIA